MKAKAPRPDAHTLAIQTLQAGDVGLRAGFRALSDRLTDTSRDLRGELATEVGLERIHRLQLAEEQRRYVDGLHGTCKESALRLNARLSEFRDRGFVGRLRWLLVGR